MKDFRTGLTVYGQSGEYGKSGKCYGQIGRFLSSVDDFRTVWKIFGQIASILDSLEDSQQNGWLRDSMEDLKWVEFFWNFEKIS